MNPLMSKGFAPLDFETDVSGLALEGAWPQELSGTLYRIGPNPRFAPIEPYNPLSGDGMVHAFRIGGDSVHYSNRWVRTRQWKLEDRAGRALFATSGDPRAHDPSVAREVTDGVANTNLIWHAGRLLALEEGHAPIELHPDTLETLGPWTFDGRLPANMTAHPKFDPRSGEMVFFANEPRRRFSGPGEVLWGVADPEGAIPRTHVLHTPFASVVHDFAVTEDFIVVAVCPVTISLTRARRGGPPLAWEPERGTHVAIARRDGTGDVRWLERSSCFVWHVLNAWNDGARVEIDVCEQRAPAFPAIDGALPAPDALAQRLTRWEIDVAGAGAINARRLSDEICEYPRIDERFSGRATRHGYFACLGGPGTPDPFHRGIAHYDSEEGSMSRLSFGSTHAASEPVFAPSSEGAAEGEGWLLCVVYDEGRDTSDLVVLDASDLDRGPIARARVPHRVPMGFHGCWVSARSRRSAPAAR